MWTWWSKCGCSDKYHYQKAWRPTGWAGDNLIVFRSNLSLPIFDRLALTFSAWSSLSYIIFYLKLWHKGYDKHVKIASDLLMLAMTWASQNSTGWLPWSPFFLSIYCSQSLELSRSVIFLQGNKISALICSSTSKLIVTCRINVLLKSTFPEI